MVTDNHNAVHDVTQPVGNCTDALCAHIVRATTAGVFICGLDGRLQLANPAFAAMLGKSADEILGAEVAQIRRLELGGMVGERNAAVLASGVAQTFEFSEITASGLRTVLITKGIYRDASGEALGVFGMVRDISAFREIEQEIIDATDREKQRLGRELRENFCQHLVGISLLGNVLHEELSRTGIEQADFARQIASLVKEVVSEVRTLEKRLSVAHLEQGEGLVEALEDLAEQVRSGGQIEAVFRGPNTKPMLEPQTAMYLFRIAQEAVHNAVTHSHARLLQIRLTTKRNAVVLSVRDDGVGFSKDEDADFEARSRIGFSIMHCRTRAIGAKLEIRHLRRGGIEVISTVPKRKTKPKRG
ncbi:MAG: PAS domain-containing protein [Verrucomicrobia bacterium]|nr:PAS domain-containing protein [Verrucomicrobiota bacterium]